MLPPSLNVSRVPTNSLPQCLHPCPLVHVNVLLNVPRQLVGILRASVPLFKDMPSFKDFKGQVEELVHKLDGYQKDQFQVPTRACTHLSIICPISSSYTQTCVSPLRPPRPTSGSRPSSSCCLLPSLAHSLSPRVTTFSCFVPCPRPLFPYLCCAQDWADTTTEALEDGELSLQMTGRVMEFDADGALCRQAPPPTHLCRLRWARGSAPASVGTPGLCWG
jgi:hypothetical protein